MITRLDLHNITELEIEKYDRGDYKVVHLNVTNEDGKKFDLALFLSENIESLNITNTRIANSL